MHKKINVKPTDLRIVRVPPMAVASIHCVGEKPEDAAGKIINDFVRDTDLFALKPDARCFGFNNDRDGVHGYEFWISIPNDMEVPAPLVKKRFDGGLYGVYTSNPVDFDEWQVVYSWVGSNGAFTYDRREPLGMDGCLEEHFNYFGEYGLRNSSLNKLLYIDFMIPTKEKEKEA